MRRVLIAGSTGKSDRDLNATFSAVLDAFWKPEQLAELCLSGKPCPSKPGSVTKKKFPEDILYAILRNAFSYSCLLKTLTVLSFIGFLLKRWGKWHLGTNLSTGDIKKIYWIKITKLQLYDLKKRRKQKFAKLNWKISTLRKIYKTKKNFEELVSYLLVFANFMD